MGATIADTATRMAAAASSQPDEERVRFEAELEFVQSLANPEYLHYLAQHRYFDDEDFVSYLQYLNYWRERPYCLYLVFPHCLRMLELLQTDAKFVEMLKRADFKDHVFTQQHYHWRYRAMEPVAATATESADKPAAAAANSGDGGAPS